MSKYRSSYSGTNGRQPSTTLYRYHDDDYTDEDEDYDDDDYTGSEYSSDEESYRGDETESHDLPPRLAHVSYSRQNSQAATHYSDYYRNEYDEEDDCTGSEYSSDEEGDTRSSYPYDSRYWNDRGNDGYRSQASSSSSWRAGSRSSTASVSVNAASVQTSYRANGRQGYASWTLTSSHTIVNGETTPSRRDNARSRSGRVSTATTSRIDLATPNSASSQSRSYRSASAQPCLTRNRVRATVVSPPPPPSRPRASTAGPRFTFNPTPSPNKSSVQKGREFEDYFKEGVLMSRVTSKVEFQKRLTPGRGDPRSFCKPDAVFTKGRKGAIVEMKNYEGTSLGKTQIDKTYNDMCALKNTVGCREVVGYIYVRYRTKVDRAVEDHARRHGISIVREGEIDADELAEEVDRKLKI